MKINSWNVRGINASNKRNLIHQSLANMKDDIVMLQETKLSQVSFDNTLAKWPKWSSVHSPSNGTFVRLVIL